MNAKPVGAIAAITQALLDLIAHFVSLLALESKVIALDLAWVSGLVISAAGLAISGWLVMRKRVANPLPRLSVRGDFGLPAMGQ